MKKLILIVLLPFLTSCMAANIALQAADVANSINWTNYNSPETSLVKFEYFDNEKETAISPFKKYFKLISKNNDFISFSASESTDSKDCFVGLKFYKADVEKNIQNLKYFISWSNNLATQTNEQSIQLKANNGKLITLLFKIDKLTNQPLLTYSGNSCGLFSKTYYYSINPDNVNKMIEEIQNWNSLLK